LVKRRGCTGKMGSREVCMVNASTHQQLLALGSLKAEGERQKQWEQQRYLLTSDICPADLVHQRSKRLKTLL